MPQITVNSELRRFPDPLTVADLLAALGRDPKVLLAHYGLSPDGIANKVRETLNSMDDSRLDSQRIRAVK